MQPPPDEQPGLQEMMDENPEIGKQFSYKKIALIILFGLLLSGFLIVSSFDMEAFKKMQWNNRALFWIFLGYLLLIARHIAFMYRLRLITNNALSWRSSFDVITLWLFSSAITPSTVGGAAAAVYFLKKEKLSVGKSATTSLLTVFLDQAIFAGLALIALFIVGKSGMFASDVDCRNNGELPLMHLFHSLESIFWWTYILYFLLVLLLAYGLFINAQSLSNILQKVFSWSFLRKWKEDALHTGNDIVATSKELKGKGIRFWMNACVATIISWVALFSISTCIIMAFFEIGIFDWLEIYARQFVVWMLMLIPATPGGTGIAELSFSALMCDHATPALAPIMALLWRTISFYPYLILGIAILPRWIKKVYS